MFIRTKDGIYDLEAKDNKGINCYQINDDFKEETYGGKTGRVLYIPSKAVLKQSDNLAELCDGFYIDVCEPIFEKQFIYPKKEYYKFLYIIEELKKENVKYTAYGFIKTDKGLIYVAKMNENGKLVLI